MSTSHLNHVWFGQGLQHLRRSPEHTTETLALLDLYGNKYTIAATRTLVSFTINTAREHEAAIAEAEHDHLEQAQNRVLQQDFRKRSLSDCGNPLKRRRCEPSFVDNSNRSQNVDSSNRSVTNVFMAPVSVHVTICSHEKHADDTGSG